MSFPISIVNACLRDGRGGSPTAVLNDPDPASGAALTDARRGEIPTRLGTSHAVFVNQREIHSRAEYSTVELRFFTGTGELPACGHGTVAALAYLADQSQAVKGNFRLRISGRSCTGHTVRDGDRIHAAFDPGPITLREPMSSETDLVVTALGLVPELLGTDPCIASLGRPRILIPVATPEAVAALTPDLDLLRAACDKFGLLGCYVHSAPTSEGRLVARMFAPAIGVPEDIANANSTACLAAHLTSHGVTGLTVDMGDSLGSPAAITTSARPSPTGPRVLVGGIAAVARTEMTA